MKWTDAIRAKLPSLPDTFTTSKQAFVFPSDPRKLLALEGGRLDVESAAARNFAARKAQLDRLTPKRSEARAVLQSIEQQRKGATTARESFELVRELKYIKGFFPSPPDLVARLIRESQITAGSIVLEPSAGKGDIALAVQKLGAKVHCIERNPQLCEHLAKLGLSVVCKDFLEVTAERVYDAVIMNPPFEQRQDVKHIQHARGFLKPGGHLVGVCCQTSGDILDEWAREHRGNSERLPAKSFASAERPTGVNCSLVTARG